MKNLGVIGNLLMGFVLIASLFESSRSGPIESSKFVMVLLLAIGYNMLAYETKFDLNHSTYSPAHGLMILIFLVNTFWCPVIEPKLSVSLAFLAYHTLLVKHSSLSIGGFAIACGVYLFEGYHLIKEKEKSFVTILKLIACGALIGYYSSHLFEKKDKEKHD